MWTPRTGVAPRANALHHGPVAAKSLLGQEAAYDRLPYFFTDQYDLSMECTGYAEPGGYDQVVIRGDVGGKFIAFWLLHGRLLAGMNVNIWQVADTIAALIRTGRPINTGRFTNPRTPLETFLEP
jgi:3-phenylpropionate/trans-cinnamate dioxygenase ferredoxin reductase subunit